MLSLMSMEPFDNLLTHEDTGKASWGIHLVAYCAAAYNVGTLPPVQSALSLSEHDKVQQRQLRGIARKAVSVKYNLLDSTMKDYARLATDLVDVLFECAGDSKLALKAFEEHLPSIFDALEIKDKLRANILSRLADAFRMDMEEEELVDMIISSYSSQKTTPKDMSKEMLTKVEKTLDALRELKKLLKRVAVQAEAKKAPASPGPAGDKNADDKNSPPSAELLLSATPVEKKLLKKLDSLAQGQSAGFDMVGVGLERNLALGEKMHKELKDANEKAAQERLEQEIQAQKDKWEKEDLEAAAKLEKRANEQKALKDKIEAKEAKAQEKKELEGFIDSKLKQHTVENRSFTKSVVKFDGDKTRDAFEKKLETSEVEKDAAYADGQQAEADAVAQSKLSKKPLLGSGVQAKIKQLKGVMEVENTGQPGTSSGASSSASSSIISGPRRSARNTK